MAKTRREELDELENYKKKLEEIKEKMKEKKKKDKRENSILENKQIKEISKKLSNRVDVEKINIPTQEELNANKELKIEDNFILDFFQRPEYKLPYFPVDAKLPLEESILEKKIKWIDTAIPNISYLSGLGGDFDGVVSRWFITDFSNFTHIYKNGLGGDY